jgi:hypothetical protein
MRIDPLEEWRRLSQLYREMSDEELYELDDDFAGLTEQAQQILRDEMRTRGLARPRPASVEANLSERSAASAWDSSADAPRAEDGAEESGLPREYTWKTLLCECNDSDEAWMVREALRQAGIESWIDGQGYRIVEGINYPRILVAADQLEQAREVATRPIPQAIVEQFRMPPEEFKPPVCPKCGAEDPLLEAVDPVNSWLCESCDYQWTDAVEDAKIPN